MTNTPLWFIASGIFYIASLLETSTFPKILLFVSVIGLSIVAIVSALKDHDK